MTMTECKQDFLCLLLQVKLESEDFAAVQADFKHSVTNLTNEGSSMKLEIQSLKNAERVMKVRVILIPRDSDPVSVICKTSFLQLGKERKQRAFQTQIFHVLFHTTGGD